MINIDSSNPTSEITTMLKFRKTSKINRSPKLRVQLSILISFDFTRFYWSALNIIAHITE